MHRIGALLLCIALSFSAASRDKLDREIDRWIAFLQSDKATGETWAQIKPSAAPMLARASEALHDGRRLLALQRFAAARTNLEAAAYVTARGEAEQKSEAALTAEWKRLRALASASSRLRLDDIHPALLRGLAEAAVPQIRGFYEASLEYGRSTMPEAGYFYLGSARAQRDFVDLAKRLSEPGSFRAPALRPLDGELDLLERSLLTAYRPPASLDKHGDFIGASSMVNEARQLNAAGLRYGALLRYLEAARRTAQISGTLLPRTEIERSLNGFQTRLKNEKVDHTIGRMFLEAAQADLEKPGPGGPTSASAIASSVLPRYFAALEPAAKPERVPARVTVTLVRWPYT